MNDDEHRPVRVTPTNAGPDSKGMVNMFGWELEGMVAFYVVAGGVVGLILVFALSGRPLTTRAFVGMVPVAASIAWVKLFVHGKPPAYQGDRLEKWYRGPNFRLRPQKWSKQIHPRNLVLRGVMKKGGHRG